MTTKTTNATLIDAANQVTTNVYADGGDIWASKEMLVDGCSPVASYETRDVGADGKEQHVVIIGGEVTTRRLVID